MGDRHLTEPMKVLVYFDLKQWNKKSTINSLGHIFDNNGRYNQIPLLACCTLLGCLPPPSPVRCLKIHCALLLVGILVKLTLCLNVYPHIPSLPGEMTPPLARVPGLKTECACKALGNLPLSDALPSTQVMPAQASVQGCSPTCTQVAPSLRTEAVRMLF